MATAEQDRATVDAAIDGVPRGLPAVDIQDLYTAHWRYLVRLAVLLVDDVASAEDVVQDSFVALHKRAGTLRVPDAALAYLRTTVTPPADFDVLVREEHRAALAAVRRLPRHQREVLVLRYWSGLSEREIAQTLGISQGSVKSAASRGLAAVQKMPRFATRLPRRRHRLGRVLAPLAAAAVVAAIIGIVVTVAHSPSGKHQPAAHSSAAPTPAPVPTAVHISLLNADGDEYGVGMPVIAYFSQPITDARALQRATTVTINGKRAAAAWYFERSSAGKGPIEGHLRLQTYWPAHAKIHVDLPAKGLSGGTGYAYDDNLTLDFRTGARNVAVVDDKTHELTLTRDGTKLWSVPVSLGAPRTPTASGTKVIMEKGARVCMRGAGYDECGIKYTQRLTYGGEFLHSAPWNVAHIREGVDSSNGCTNLLPADAKKLYTTLRVGDVVRYPDAAGARMTLGAGYGDWNVDWATWLTGGLVPTR